MSNYVPIQPSYHISMIACYVSCESFDDVSSLLRLTSPSKKASTVQSSECFSFMACTAFFSRSWSADYHGVYFHMVGIPTIDIGRQLKSQQAMPSEAYATWGFHCESTLSLSHSVDHWTTWAFTFTSRRVMERMIKMVKSAMESPGQPVRANLFTTSRQYELELIWHPSVQLWMLLPDLWAIKWLRARLLVLLYWWIIHEYAIIQTTNISLPFPHLSPRWNPCPSRYRVQIFICHAFWVHKANLYTSDIRHI